MGSLLEVNLSPKKLAQEIDNAKAALLFQAQQHGSLPFF